MEGPGDNNIHEQEKKRNKEEKGKKKMTAEELEEEEKGKKKMTVEKLEEEKPKMAGDVEAVLKYMNNMMEKLTNLEAGTSEATSKVTICKVKYEERQTHDGNEEEDPYTPRVVSIGPFHRGKKELKEMEKFKWRYLKKFLGEKEDTLAKYLEAATSKEKEAEGYFPSGVFKKLDDKEENDTFSVMLVLDGCFLMEFLRKSRRPADMQDDVLSDFGWRLPWIKHDMLLFENQIPFFVLEALYEVFVEVTSSPTNIKDLAIDYLYNTELLDQNRNFWALYADKDPAVNGENISEPSHLLHLYHTIAVETQHKLPFSIRQMIKRKIKFVKSFLVNIVYFPIYYFYIFVIVKPTLYPTKISTATELEQAGVKFQGSFMDLRFRKGTLFIPVFSLNYHSFSLLKNLIALEYYHPQPIRPYIYCYAEFLTELIRSSDDLEIMENLDIIMVQNKEAGIHLINNLLTEPELRGKLMHFKINANFGYWQNPLERQKEILKFCKNPGHRWGRKLMKDYFDSPWSILGVLVALILLVLTVLQTIYTIK